jgi:transcriptional regulator with XRE-family HTH domain
MIAAQCRAARGLLNMTVKELAARARVAPDTIVRLENGRELKPCTLKAIRKALEAAGVEFLPAGVRFNCGPMCGWGPIRQSSQSPARAGVATLVTARAEKKPRSSGQGSEAGQ